jgi:hypothetical protein
MAGISSLEKQERGRNVVVDFGGAVVKDVVADRAVGLGLVLFGVGTLIQKKRKKKKTKLAGLMI